MHDFAVNQQIFSLPEKSKLTNDRKPWEPFYQAKLSTSEIVSFPKETSDLSKAIVDVPERQSSRENYLQHLLTAKELYTFAAPRMIETVKDQFHKEPQWDII